MVERATIPPHVLKAAQNAANLVRYEESAVKQERIIARYMMAAIAGKASPDAR